MNQITMAPLNCFSGPSVLGAGGRNICFELQPTIQSSARSAGQGRGWICQQLLAPWRGYKSSYKFSRSHQTEQLLALRVIIFPYNSFVCFPSTQNPGQAARCIIGPRFSRPARGPPPPPNLCPGSLIKLNELAPNRVPRAPLSHSIIKWMDANNEPRLSPRSAAQDRPERGELFIDHLQYGGRQTIRRSLGRVAHEPNTARQPRFELTANLTGQTERNAMIAMMGRFSALNS